MLDLTSAQLRQAANIKDQIAALEKQLAEITGTKATPVQTTKAAKKKGGLSAAGRARIAAAQKARWARVKGVKGKTIAEKVIQAVKAAQKPAKKKFAMSAAAKAILSAKAKARWAAKKAGQKK
jgi:hypothetical protein